MLPVVKESRNLIFSILIFLVCYALLAAIAIRPVFSFDGYWHLQMGKDLLEQGLSPWIDHYSFSHSGNDISTIPVIFQTFLHVFVSTFGEEAGFYYIRLFYLTLLMASLFVYFRKIEANAFIVFLILPLITYFIHIRLMIRPEIFSNVLIVLCLVLYLKAQKTFGTKELIYICLLLLFWVNYHSPVMGYIIVFGLFLDKAINKYLYGDASFSWNHWFVWGLVIFSIGFIRPGGLHFMMTVLNVIADGFGKYTGEYAESYPLYAKDYVVHISWVLSVYVVIWSLIKKQFGFAFVAVLFTYFSFSTVRMITATTLVNLCILTHYFSHISFSHHLTNIRSSIKNIMLIVAVGISVLAFYSVGKEVESAMKKNDIKLLAHEHRYPVQVVDYLKKHHDGGNILNIMRVGGYLINKLSPDFKVYFDGRTNILYPIEFFEHNMMLPGDVNALNDVVQQHDVQYAIYPNSPEVYTAFHLSEKLGLEFADKKFLLFSDNKSNAYPLSSLMLVSPSCWNDDWSPDVKKEIVRSSELNDNAYTIKYVLELLNEYLAYENKQQFFDNLILDKLKSDEIRRVVLHLAINTGHLDAARAAYGSILEKSEYDILIYSHYLVKNKVYRDAEDVLYSFYIVTRFVKKKIVAFEKIEIMIRILKILEKEDELRRFESSYIETLKGKLDKGSYIMQDELSFKRICH